MDIRSIKIFNSLAASLHFGKTSRAYHMTPSTLTRLVQRLEAEVGKQLFRRDRRSVSLTPAGMLFKEYAEETEQRWNALQNRLAAEVELRGNISLYCSVTAANGILPAILKTFRAHFPGIQLHLQTGDAAMALDQLQNKAADVTIAALPEKLPASITFIEIIRTPLVFVAPAGHQELIVYREGEIDWESTPLILPEKGLSRVRMDKWFRENSIKPNVYAQVAGNEALLTMVGLGYGVGVIPKLVLEKSLIHHEVVTLENAPILTPFTIGVCTAKKNMDNPLIKAFWSTVQKGERSM
ncbi:HTH-type transcriptional activator IlvY [Desulfogranum marinum]|jgi:LysR family positive regulator for ilvC|uniref:HTH-type transcriptional activator IlvY n=1 Tax=Desulfogranum marinum TaxID=453220 RepID=UPI0029C67D5F|nr:HTH-type transcriptional activator IlvY [Desulfogranum marinum]